jgi:hypothetical protein
LDLRICKGARSLLREGSAFWILRIWKGASSLLGEGNAFWIKARRSIQNLGMNGGLWRRNHGMQGASKTQWLWKQVEINCWWEGQNARQELLPNLQKELFIIVKSLHGSCTKRARRMQFAAVYNQILFFLLLLHLLLMLVLVLVLVLVMIKTSFDMGANNNAGISMNRESGIGRREISAACFSSFLPTFLHQWQPGNTHIVVVVAAAVCLGSCSHGSFFSENMRQHCADKMNMLTTP